jgi:Alginate export
MPLHNSMRKESRVVTAIVCASYCAALAGVCAYAQTGQQGQSDCPSSPPAYPSKTYDEDFRYLANPQCRTEPLDGLKYIPLRGENVDYYFSLGAWIRERAEYFNNVEWGLGGPGNAYPMQRYELHTDLHLGPRFRFFGELASSIENGRNGGPRPLLDEEKMYVHQGFFDIGLWKSGKSSVTLRAGREEMEYGNRYLISARDGRNIRRSFNGFRLTALTGDWTVDAFAVRPTLDNPGYFDDPPDHISSFWGVYAVRPFHILPGGHVDLYYLGLDDKTVFYVGRGTGREQRETVGARLWGKVSQWDYNEELTFQWGKFQSDDIRAWAVTTELGYRVDTIPLQPRFGIRQNIFSGNHNPTGRSLGTFNSLFQTGPYFSYAELFGNRNLIDFQPSVEFVLSKNVTLTPNVAPFWRESTLDGLYTSSGGLVVSGQNSRARFVGTQLAAQLRWKIDRHTTFVSEYLHFFPGAFLRQTTPGRNINYWTGFFDFRF